MGDSNTMGRPGRAWCKPTVAKNSTVSHRQQANETYGKAHQIFENSATMYKALKHYLIETIEDSYIEELHNKYTGFMGVKAINLVHHTMDIYKCKNYRNGPQGELEEI